jgi:hypothetical protein
MKETQLFGLLFPSHLDLLPILENIREKYDIFEKVTFLSFRRRIDSGGLLVAPAMF